jgi:hypothetical protein
VFGISSEVGVRLNDQFNPSLKAKAYLDRNRRAKLSVPRAAPSNIIVAPPSGTLLIDGGIGWGVALALWLNASIRAQTAPEASTSLFERVFNFMPSKRANSVPKPSVCKIYYKPLSSNELTGACICGGDRRNRKVFRQEVFRRLGGRSTNGLSCC